jgi:hypothetical protein
MAEPAHEVLPDFTTHPHYQPLFDALVTGGHDRDQATLLLVNLWRNRANNPAPQQHGNPQPPEPLQQPQRPQPPVGDEEQPQPPQDGQEEPHQLQPPHPNLVPPGALPAPQELPPLQPNDQDWLAQERAEKRPQLPPIDLEAESRTLSMQRPTTYAIEKLRKYEYIPLWYFTIQGCQATDRDKAANDDLWDVTKTNDNRLTLRSATSNRPNPNALTDEQLSWEQFMDSNHLLCRWLIPLGWPEGYAKVLLSFFYQIENHEDIGIDEGKETLLLYQARARKAWHDELKAGHFFNLAKLSDKRLIAYRKEIDAKHNAILRKAVSPSPD